MRITLQEFLDAEDPTKLVHGDEHQTTQDETQPTHKTSDQAIQATRQGVTLPIMNSIGLYEDDIENPEVKNLKDKLKEAARANAWKLAEQLLNQKKKEDSDIINKTPIPSIEQLKEKEGIIIEKLDKLMEFCKNNFTPTENKALISYFNSTLNA